MSQPPSARTIISIPLSSILMKQQSITISDEQSLLSNYSYSSLYKTETLINAHLKENWNTCFSRMIATSELLIGFTSLIIGILIIVFQLTLYQTGHAVWTGATIFIAGIFTFLTLFNRHHHFFLIVSLVHILASLTSTVMIFVSILGIMLKNTTFQHLQIEQQVGQATYITKIDYSIHGTLIGLGLLEKILSYTLIITIIRQTLRIV
ncbi:unnamed protein product [Didymodactylos carnosus]|uniref:Uncharacterized protein n=1 Tax=Didymodactylos carnosus TaxID=1234261 RepID=A0A813TLV3_9BILA|nr:unnamed protein product [Didymodactylos carnosus]CAF3599459.1 unnamed protein product [Didymodactylos carnosus]